LSSPMQVRLVTPFGQNFLKLTHCFEKAARSEAHRSVSDFFKVNQLCLDALETLKGAVIVAHSYPAAVRTSKISVPGSVFFLLTWKWPSTPE